MATIVLGAVGSSVAGPIGAIVGSTVGSVIDNFLISKLFPQDQNVTGPRLDSLQFSTAGEGTPIEWVLGPKTGVSGHVLWRDTLEEVENQEDVQAGPSSSSAGTVTSFTYFQSLAICFGEVTHNSSLYQKIERARKLLGDTKLLWDNGEVAKYDSITWYLGDQTTPDPLMEAKLGAGNVPKYKYLVYCVIERLQLADFGNRLPNLKVTLEQGADVSLQDAIRLLVDRAKLDPDVLVDVTRLPYCFRGLGVTGPVATNNSLSLLGQAYAVDARENGTQIAFIAKGFEDVVEVLTNLIGTVNEPGLTFSDTPEWEVPSSAEVTYVGWENEAQRATESYYDPTRPDESKVSMNLPMTLTSAEAQAVAKRLVWSARSERIQYDEFSLPPSLFNIAPGDVIQIDDGTQIFITETGLGTNYEMRARGHAYDQRVYRQLAIESTSNNEDQGYNPPDTHVNILQMNAPKPAGAESPGLFFAVRPDPVTAQFIGAQVFASIDDIDYTNVGSVNNSAKMGRVIAYTGFDAGPFFLDGANEFIIEMDDDTTLSTGTEAEVYAGSRNVLAVEVEDAEYGRDWEILAFVNATSLGNNQYRISNLLRGLRGTEALINSQAGAGQRVVVLDRNVGLWTYDTSIYPGILTYIKVPAEGGSLSAHDAKRVVPDARNMWPYAPTNLTSQVEYRSIGNYDVVIRWDDRTKANTEPFALVPAASDDEINQWEVEVRAGGRLSEILYTETVTDTKFEFTQAKRQTVEDAGDPFWLTDDGFTVHIRKVSSIGGVGRRASLSVERRT